MDVEQDEVVEGETQEQHPPENVAPNVDRLVGPPEYAAKKTTLRKRLRKQSAGPPIWRSRPWR